MSTTALSSVNTKSIPRRPITYTSLADLSRDLDAIEASHRAGTLRPLGNRDPGPILEHLAVSIRGSFDGIPELKGAGAWWLRLLGPLVKSRVLSSPLQPGVRMGSRAEAALWNDSAPFDQGLANLRAQITRLSQPNATPIAAHPFFGKLSPAEWRTFHLRHAELHLSFLQL